MKSILLLLFCGSALADVVTLKDGGQISGMVESGNRSEIRIKVGDESRGFALDQVESIQFDLPGALTTSLATPGTTSGTPVQVGPQSITIPAGTEIAIRTIDRIDSKTADESKEYAASLDDPIVVDGVTVVPANASAFLRVSDIKNPKMRRASMSISVVAVMINGQRVKVETSTVDSQSGSRAKRTAAGAAIGAGGGAAIGALAGGPLGAGIGAGVGALGGGIAGRMSAKPVEIPAETRFTYKLSQAAMLNSQEVAR